MPSSVPGTPVGLLVPSPYINLCLRVLNVLWRTALPPCKDELEDLGELISN